MEFSGSKLDSTRANAGKRIPPGFPLGKTRGNTRVKPGRFPGESQPQPGNTRGKPGHLPGEKRFPGADFRNVENSRTAWNTCLRWKERPGITI